MPDSVLSSEGSRSWNERYDEIDRIIEALHVAWKDQPELSFGQLVDSIKDDTLLNRLKDSRFLKFLTDRINVQLPEIDDWNAERNVGQPNIEQATAIALDTLDLLADEWEKDIDVPFIATSLANTAKSSSISAMMRQCFIEGAYRASQVMVKTASSQSSSAASSDHEDTNKDPKS